METLAERTTRPPGTAFNAGEIENSSSGVSWAAIIAGGVASTSLALILLTLGVGLGLSSLSPWSNTGASAATIGVVAIIWLIFTHIAASGMGGYLAGRLRTKWAGIHTDEVYFRDTAHGFLAWAVASVVAAALLGSVMTSIVGGSVKAAGAAASTVASTAASGLAQAQGQSSNVMDYFADSLFRSDHPARDSNDGSGRIEAGRILSTALTHGALDPADKAYLAQVISARTGLPELDAAKRVDDTFARARAEAAKAEAAAKQAADAARKAAAHSALWMFVALLSGAFAASYAATWGGRRRDHVNVTARGLNPVLAPQ
jgi:hypothetical protein